MRKKRKEKYHNSNNACQVLRKEIVHLECREKNTLGNVFREKVECLLEYSFVSTIYFQSSFQDRLGIALPLQQNLTVRKVKYSFWVTQARKVAYDKYKSNIDLSTHIHHSSALCWKKDELILRRVMQQRLCGSQSFSFILFSGYFVFKNVGFPLERSLSK